MSNRTNRRPGRPKSTQTGLDVLVALADLGRRATAQELGVSNATLRYLASERHKAVRNTGATVKVTDAEGNPSRGRPATLWALTSTGRTRVKRARASQEQAAA